MQVKFVAEIALKVTNLAQMVAFYQEELGFEMHLAYEKYVFLKIADLPSPLGEIGHPLILGLFDRDSQPDIQATTLDHLAFEIPTDDYDNELARFQSKGMVLRQRAYPDTLDWRARSFFIRDPEGNVLEFIAAN